MTITAFPLSWPVGFDRTSRREAGRFKTTLASAIKNVQESLRLFSADSGKRLENLTISSNVSLGVAKPADPGVAVWFVWDGMQICIAVDRYTTVEGNLQAIHHIIEARRVELRHGTLALVRATFQGFRALPAPPDAQDWRAVLGVGPGASIEDAKKAYRKAAAEHHPDKGGEAAAMARINQAWEQAQKDVGAV